MQVLAFSAAIILSGCVATHGPPKLTDEQRQLLWENDFPKITVAVAPNPVGFASARDADDLIDALRRTRLFRRVEYADRLQVRPDLVIYAHPRRRLFCGLPYMGTILSFGVLPGHEIRDYTIGFTAEGPRPERKRQVVFVRKDRRVLGWIALLFPLLPNWHFSYPQDRYVEHYALFLISKSELIQGLVKHKQQ